MRSLTLKRENVADLTSDELADVQGAAIPTLLGVCQWTQPSSPIKCVTEHTTCLCR